MRGTMSFKDLMRGVSRRFVTSRKPRGRLRANKKDILRSMSWLTDTDSPIG